MGKRIFITGGSGCIGHYAIEQLAANPAHELFVLVRDPAKLRADLAARANVTVLKGDLKRISQFGDLLKTMQVAIAIATAWGGADTFDVNVVKTQALMELLDPQVCERVLYFSTASILGRDGTLLKEAGQIGTDYIRTKYDFAQRLGKLAIAPKITCLYPTLVLGGGPDGNPTSHLTGGIAEVVAYLPLLRWLRADGSFHFIHAYDIAQVVCHLVETPPEPDSPGPHHLVLGNDPLTVDAAIADLCAYRQVKRGWMTIPLSFALANVLIDWFKVQLAPWDRFCMAYRHFTYEPYVNAATYGRSPHCPRFVDVLRLSGIAPGAPQEVPATVADDAAIAPEP